MEQPQSAVMEVSHPQQETVEVPVQQQVSQEVQQLMLVAVVVEIKVVHLNLKEVLEVVVMVQCVQLQLV